MLQSRELFRLRSVCGHFSDNIKTVWCQVVKDEMMEQVASLDLLYEKETTAKLLEFKLKYLVSYAQLMHNYFIHMNWAEMVSELLATNDIRGKKLMLIVASVVGPNLISYPSTIEAISEADTGFAEEYLLSETFKEKFESICKMDSIPEVSLA